MLRPVLPPVIIVMALAGCGAAALPQPDLVAHVTTDPAPTTVAAPPQESSTLLRCDEVAPPVAPDDWYRPTPVYVGNEMPIDKIRSFAAQLDGYADVWIDRDHNGWVTVGFVDADVRAYQITLEAEFPDAGLVAVGVPYSVEELVAIRDRLQRERPDDMFSPGFGVARGVVELWIGDITPERLELAATIIGNDPVCVEGINPGDRPSPGPQPAGGEGWAYVAEFDERSVGSQPVVIADAATLADLWLRIGEGAEIPQISFEENVMLAIEVGHSGSCPVTRLDAVSIEGSLVYATIVHVNSEMSCTADYIPRVYLVAVERGVLPAPPFNIASSLNVVQRTHVTADLRVPGASLSPNDAESISVELPRTATPMPSIIETGFAVPITIDSACGIESLGEINDVDWVTTDGTTDLPEAWGPLVADGLLDIEILIEEGPPPTLVASAGDHSVVYMPGDPGSAVCP